MICITRRAVVDLPQPDSPTMPSVSPLATLKSTPSTARTTPLLPLPRSPLLPPKCLVSPRTSSSGVPRPPRSRPVRSGGAPMIIAGPPWRRAERLAVDRGAQRVEHQPPFRLGRLHAEAEEGEAGGEDHRDADQARRIDEDRAEHIAEDMHPDDRQRAGARDARRLDEVAIA